MPKKPSEPEKQNPPDGATGSGSESRSRPDPAPPDATRSADEPEPRQAPTRRNPRGRRLVWLSVAATTLVGSIWTAFATSMVDNARTYLDAKLEVLQGGAEIKRLHAELERTKAEHIEALTRKDNAYDALLANTGMGLTAYVYLSFRNQQFCLDQVKAWARASGYPFEDVNDPLLYIVRVGYFGTSLELRCVGAPFANATFLVVTGTVASKSQVDSAQAALRARFADYNQYPAVASPAARDWNNIGPYLELGYVSFEMSYGEFRRWEKGAFPPTLLAALTRPGTITRSYSAKGFYFFSADEPGSSVTIRNPDTLAYKLLAQDGTWRPPAEVLAPNTVPADGTTVRTDVLIAVAGMAYGQYGIDSTQQRYLGQDAIDRLATIPGIVDGGTMNSILRNW